MAEQLPLRLEYPSSFKSINEFRGYHLCSAAMNGSGVIFKLGTGPTSSPTEIREVDDRQYKALNPNGNVPEDLSGLIAAIELILQEKDRIMHQRNLQH